MNKQLVEAIQAHLATLVAKDTNARTLLEIEQFAHCAREMLAVGAEGDMLPRRRNSSIVQFSSNPSYVVSGSINSYAEGVGDSEDAVSPPSQDSETFGATFIREMIAARSAKDASPVQLVEAIAMAREKGMDDIAAKLETQLDADDTPAEAAQQ